ncbi:hypothetical protein LCGC14_1346270 [marine sediment metagenome]|uniref:Uncharacterized protein n=1 Tax=marine sediment metagenome TaxID=412755 RepID=A0A0F9KYE8_9ZZZZ
MKTVSGLSAPLVALDGKPLKDMVEPAKNPCTTCGQMQEPAKFRESTVADLIARALITEKDSQDPVRAFVVATEFHKAEDTLTLDKDDFDFVVGVMKESEFGVLAKAQCLIVLDAAKQRED